MQRLRQALQFKFEVFFVQHGIFDRMAMLHFGGFQIIARFFIVNLTDGFERITLLGAAFLPIGGGQCDLCDIHCLLVSQLLFFRQDFLPVIAGLQTEQCGLFLLQLVIELRAVEGGEDLAFFHFSSGIEQQRHSAFRRRVQFGTDCCHYLALGGNIAGKIAGFDGVDAHARKRHGDI